MSKLSISLITVTYNAADTIETCIRSVIAQGYLNLQYIIVDGGSTDGTLAIIDKYKQHISILVSEPDKGIYDAMNKGIAMATSEVIGILNADDRFAANDILDAVAETFDRYGTDIIYGDIDYINKQNKVFRKWRSGEYRRGSFNLGWMPPHPAFYAKRKCFEHYGNYDLSYGSAADYELMLRFIHRHKLSVAYVKRLMVNMLIGGVSNNSVQNRFKAWQNDKRAMAANDISMPLLCIFFKPLRKIFQYI
ncbi:glycosyltransferase family 2 protein [Mucilaginibacter myungsuensis]|uniref:Glycosyltransferase n=1 Tax=Mucilaginibacter myungsuensis TaxID=649104 RepID=A0A929PV66_9SPHI|nr:glycosyltransferase family 2 protein [Mucilaginibacter myungsuensis]MBE9660814.1 glycosyltransferase [Mucilaginibacter myungsuensis]MDN3600860.1 glycosyltransferase family 2 protein [Mucilaginibacter myungsuensis]